MNPIYKSKLLIPNFPSIYCEREIATQKLDTIPQSNLVVVKAPDGMGKTSLLANWCKNKNNICWYSLNENDNDLLTFLTYLINSIRNVEKDFLIENEADVIGAIDNIDYSCLLFSNALIECNKQLVIVLDNYHFIQSPKIHSFISILLTQQIPSFCLIVSSIKSLPIDYSFIKGSDLLAEISEGDIKFTKAEVKRYLQKKGVHTSYIEKYYFIYRQTQGVIWLLNAIIPSLNESFNEAKCLSIIYKTIKEMVLAKSTGFSDGERYMLNLLILLPYFNQDIFSRLKKQAELSDIEYDSFVLSLLRSHFFISENLSGENSFNSVIQSFIKHDDIVESDPELINDSYKTIAKWCSENNLLKDAVFYNIKTGNIDEAIKLFKICRTKLVAGGNWHELSELLNLFEDDTQRTDLTFKLSWIWRALFLGELETIVKELDTINASEIELQEDLNLLGEYYLFKAYVSLHSSFDIINWGKYGQMAVANIASNNYYPMGLAWLFKCSALQVQGKTADGVKMITTSIKNSDNLIIKSYQLIALCYIHYMEANMVDLLSAANQLQRLGKQSGNREIMLSSHYFLGISKYNQHLKDEAIEHFSQFLNHKKVNIIPHRYFALVALVIAKIDILSLEQLNEMLDDINEMTIGRGEVRLYRYSKAITSLVYWRKLKDSSSLVWARTAKYTPFLPMSFFVSIPLIQAYILMGSDAKDQEIAMSILTDVIAYTEKVNNIHFYNQAKLLHTVLLQKMGRDELALESFKELIDKIKVKGSKLSFLTLDKSIITLLSQIKIGDEYKAFVNSLLPADAVSDISGEKDELTTREVEILKLLKTKLMNKDIGEKLFISEKTVKRHISNIYKKIGAANRSEAIKKAKDWIN